MSADSNRVLVVGARGRMGRLAVAAIEAAPDLNLVGTVVRGENLASALDRLAPDVAVDLTLPTAVAPHLQTYLDARTSPVVGTSGLDPEQLAHFMLAYQEAALPGLLVPNFALGAVLMMEFARRAARLLPNVEIVEAHHPGKLDAPSGTARRTAAEIESARSSSEPVPIHSIRIPGFLAQQEVIFGGQDERLSLRHDTISRECYMPGLLLSIRGVDRLDGLQIGLECVLDGM